MPLSVEEVARFWANFHTRARPGHRRLDAHAWARSAEVLALNPEDVLLSEAQLQQFAARVCKLRFLPWRRKPHS